MGSDSTIEREANGHQATFNMVTPVGDGMHPFTPFDRG